MKLFTFRRFIPAMVTGAGLLIAVSLPHAEARIGETLEQIVERYGKPIRDSEPIVTASESAAIYFKDNVEVTVEFKRGKAWLVSYRTNTMTSELELSLRDANDGLANGIVEWKDSLKHLGRTYWLTADKEIYAVRYDTGNSKIFRFCNRECKDAMGVERREKIKDARPGVLEPGDTPEEEAGEPSTDGF